MKLILTADDFGISSEVNAAVLEAHRRGALTAASLMVGGDAFEEAVQIARRTPSLAVGLHLVLVDGNPVLPAARLDQIVDETGRFADAPARLGLRYATHCLARRQMHAELEAQFERFASTGLPLTHVDGHQHMHLHPAACGRVVELASRFGAMGIRAPVGELRPCMKLDRRHCLRKLAWATELSLLARRCRRLAVARNLRVADRVYGLMHTGTMSTRYVMGLLQETDRGSTEIYFHPTTGSRTARLGANPQELAVLLDPALRRRVSSADIRLGTYRDLARDGS